LRHGWVPLRDIKSPGGVLIDNSSRRDDSTRSMGGGEKERIFMKSRRERKLQREEDYKTGQLNHKGEKKNREGKLNYSEMGGKPSNIEEGKSPRPATGELLSWQVWEKTQPNKVTA